MESNIPAAVDVVFVVVRTIIVDDKDEIFDIETSRADRRSDLRDENKIVEFTTISITGKISPKTRMISQTRRHTVPLKTTTIICTRKEGGTTD